MCHETTSDVNPNFMIKDTKEVGKMTFCVRKLCFVCTEFICCVHLLTIRRVAQDIYDNSHAAGEQQRETTDPGNNQFPHRRQSRPVREKGERQCSLFILKVRQQRSLTLIVFKKL